MTATLPDYAGMTLGELYAAAEANGFEFRFHAGGGVQVGSPLMGWDRDGKDRHTHALNAAMRRRWREFVGFVELRLLAAGNIPPDPLAPAVRA